MRNDLNSAELDDRRVISTVQHYQRIDQLERNRSALEEVEVSDNQGEVCEDEVSEKEDMNYILINYSKAMIRERKM